MQEIKLLTERVPIHPTVLQRYRAILEPGEDNPVVRAVLLTEYGWMWIGNWDMRGTDGMDGNTVGMRDHL